MKNQPTNPITHESAELRAVSPFVRFLEASFFAAIFRRETISAEVRAASQAEPESVPDVPKVKRAAAGAQQ
jgi:hypothetical protein